ncbi:MAG: D-glycerate dehydrogenase, partial [Hyphomicrobiales bacterium]
MRPKIVVTRRLPQAVEARWRRDYEGVLNEGDAVYGADALLQLADGADALLCAPGDKIDAALIARLPDTIKVVGTFSVGYDHVDAKALRARGIALCNTPDVLSLATAEVTLLLILAAARR